MMKIIIMNFFFFFSKENRSKLSVTICDEIIIAYDCGKESSKWISDYLGFEAKIVYKSTEDLRIIEKNLPPKNELLKQPEVKKKTYLFFYLYIYIFSIISLTNFFFFFSF